MYDKSIKVYTCFYDGLFFYLEQDYLINSFNFGLIINIFSLIMKIKPFKHWKLMSLRTSSDIVLLTTQTGTIIPLSKTKNCMPISRHL